MVIAVAKLGPAQQSVNTAVDQPTTSPLPSTTPPSFHRPHDTQLSSRAAAPGWLWPNLGRPTWVHCRLSERIRRYEPLGTSGTALLRIRTGGPGATYAFSLRPLSGASLFGQTGKPTKIKRRSDERGPLRRRNQDGLECGSQSCPACGHGPNPGPVCAGRTFRTINNSSRLKRSATAVV